MLCYVMLNQHLVFSTIPDKITLHYFYNVNSKGKFSYYTDKWYIIFVKNYHPASLGLLESPDTVFLQQTKQSGFWV